MKSKLCSRCECRKNLGDFAINKSKSDGRATLCKSCMRAYGRDHYQRNKRYYADKARRHKAKIRPALRREIELFRSAPCVDCGLKHPLHRMQCDHVRGKKLFGISQAVELAVSLPMLKRELAKCEPVCANCHADRTHYRRERKKILCRAAGDGS